MGKFGSNKLKVNRLANRQSDLIRIASKPFRFSAEWDSNRLYIVCLKGPETRAQKRAEIKGGHPDQRHRGAENAQPFASWIPLFRAITMAQEGRGSPMEIIGARKPAPTKKLDGRAPSRIPSFLRASRVNKQRPHKNGGGGVAFGGGRR
jgi:hypothetical protein